MYVLHYDSFVYVCVYEAGSKRSSEDGKEGPKVDVQLVMATATLTKAVRALLDDVSAVRVDGGIKVFTFHILYNTILCMYVYIYVCMYECDIRM